MKQNPDQANSATVSFRRLIGWTLATAVVAIVLALIYLSLEEGPMPLHMIVATILGVGFTVLLGGGLMALVYLSANSGRDDSISRRHEADDR